MDSEDDDDEEAAAEEEDDDGSVSSTDSDSTAICYVLGDVTHPHATRGDAVIVHCVGADSELSYKFHSIPLLCV